MRPAPNVSPECSPTTIANIGLEFTVSVSKFIDTKGTLN
jgi:hypothetical protein